MRMSVNENESVDIHLYANRRSNSIDLEDINRMERPSRVFSSRHNLMPPAVGGWSHLLLDPVEQAEQYRRQYPYYHEPPYTSRIGGSTANGDNTRNRSPFVRFTITDPETQQITAAGQIPLNSPPTTTQANILASNAELGLASDPLNESSDDIYDDEFMGLRIRRYHVDQNRRYMDHLTGQTPQHLRNSRSGRRTRRYTEHPYIHPYLRSNFDNNPSNSRFHHNRRARFSSTNRGYNDRTPERAQTPEQELPEVLAQDMEQETQFEEDYLTSQDSTSTFSLRSTFVNSENENSIEDEGDRVTLDVPNETPRTRVVPFIMSPTPIQVAFSPNPDPTDALDIPTATMNNNMSTAIQFDLDDNPVPVFRELASPILPPFINYNQIRISVIPAHTNDVDLRSSAHNTETVSRTSDADLNTSNTTNTTNDTVNNTLDANEMVDQNNDDNQNIILRPPSRAFAPTVQEGDQSGVTEESVTVQHAEEHPESYEELNDQITRLFECPVCFEHIVPPIFQCLFGHLICNKCVIMCENCPTCRNPFNSKRNLYMEKVGYLIKFPCKNALTGCKQQMFLGQKETHEQECCYRHYQCFFTNCTWKGYYPELHVHMVNSHNGCILNGTDRNFDVLLPNNHNPTYKWFLIAHNEYFAVIAQVSAPPRTLKIQVNLLGPDVKAKQFTFTIKLTQQKSPSDTKQKLIYERTTLPYSDIHDLSNNNVLKKDVFTLTSDMLETFTKRKRRRRLPVNLIIDQIS